MILVIAETPREANAFAHRELSVPSGLVTTLETFTELDPWAELSIHYLPSGHARRDIHVVADIIRDAQDRHLTVTHVAHDDWEWTEREPVQIREPLRVKVKLDEEWLREKVEELSQPQFDVFRTRIERLQRAVARLRVELDDATDPDADYQREPGIEAEGGGDDLRSVIQAHGGAGFVIEPNDSDRGADEVEGRGLTRPRDVKVRLMAPEGTPAPDWATSEEAEFAGLQLTPEQKHEDLKSRARELGIRVTSQKPERLAEQITQAEAERARIDADGPPF